MRLLIEKLIKAKREGGVQLILERSNRLLEQNSLPLLYKKYIRGMSGLDSSLNYFKDVLFINGCYLDHPSRYRVEHQVEQLKYFNMSCDSVFFNELRLESVYRYRAFVFFRCEHTEELELFVSEIKKFNKISIFDIDDLIYDRSYVSTIKHLESLSKADYDNYMKHVDGLGRMAKLCDFATTTTPTLADELLKITNNVYVNKNVASGEMIEYSEAANQSVSDREDSDIVRIGYLSGSITHSPDIALIEDAIYSVAKSNPLVRLVLVGLIEPSSKLNELGSQLIISEFVKWHALPELLASMDINLVPLEDSLFNHAKSENKWLEASLVRVPSVASDIGPFSDVIKHGVNGYLCKSSNDWIDVLNTLVNDSNLRTEVGNQAYSDAHDYYTTQKSGLGLADYIKSKLKPLYVFVIPNVVMSGGMRVILKHAKVLKEQGNDVLLYCDDFCDQNVIHFEGTELPILSSLNLYIDSQIDNFIATLWTTVNRVLTHPKAHRRLYFVQNYESDFYENVDLETKIVAGSTYANAEFLEYKTISLWCKEWLKSVYDADAQYVENGINNKYFFSIPRAINLNHGVIDILVEGDCIDTYKNVDESMRIVTSLKKKYGKNNIVCHYMSYRSEPKASYPVDCFYNKVNFEEVPAIYRNCDVLIKSSRVESFSYPPIEMMATGGLVIVALNGGNSEYVKHKQNCMVYDLGNEDQAVDHFHEIISNVELRNSIISGGLETAKKRDWSELESKIAEFWQ